jgi:hypothetical protein
MDLWLRRRVFLNGWKRGWEYNSASDQHNLYLDHYIDGRGYASPELSDHGDRSVLRYSL